VARAVFSARLRNPRRDLKRENQLLGKRSANRLTDQHILSQKRHRGHEFGTCSPIALRTRHCRQVATAGHRAGFIGQNLGGAKARIDFDTERLAAVTQPLGHIAKADTIEIAAVYCSISGTPGIMENWAV